MVLRWQWCWWLNDDDYFKMLMTKQVCWWHSNRSPTSLYTRIWCWRPICYVGDMKFNLVAPGPGAKFCNLVHKKTAFLIMQFQSRRSCSTRCCWFLFDCEPLNIFLSLQLVEDTLLQNNLEKSNTTRLLLNLVSLRILNSYLNLNFCPINNVKFRDGPKTKKLRDFYTCFCDISWNCETLPKILDT